MSASLREHEISTAWIRRCLMQSLRTAARLTGAAADKANRREHLASSCSCCFNNGSTCLPLTSVSYSIPFFSPPTHLLLLANPLPPSCISSLRFGSQQHLATVAMETVGQQQVGCCCCCWLLGGGGGLLSSHSWRSVVPLLNLWIRRATSHLNVNHEQTITHQRERVHPSYQLQPDSESGSTWHELGYDNAPIQHLQASIK